MNQIHLREQVAAGSGSAAGCQSKKGLAAWQVGRRVNEKVTNADKWIRSAPFLFSLASRHVLLPPSYTHCDVLAHGQHIHLICTLRLKNGIKWFHYFHDFSSLEVFTADAAVRLNLSTSSPVSPHVFLE